MRGVARASAILQSRALRASIHGCARSELSLTGDARLEFLRNSRNENEMKMERAGQ